MIVKLERSGGFAGIPAMYEIDVMDLPSHLVTIAKDMSVNKSWSMSMKSIPKGAADQFVYKISIIDGENKIIFDCNQNNLRHDLKLLVDYIEKHSKKVHGNH